MDSPVRRPWAAGRERSRRPTQARCRRGCDGEHGRVTIVRCFPRHEVAILIEFPTGSAHDLRADGQLVAAHLGMRTATTLHYWFTAYSPDFQQYSPGRALLLEPFPDLVDSFAAVEDYYQIHGRDWERYAWIRARPVAGDVDAGLKAVMEAENLPSPEVFIGLVNYINTLSDSEIDSKIREYASNFERLAKNHKKMAKRDFTRIIADGGYAGVLNREERIGILILEGLKNYIGKPTLVTMEVPSRVKETFSDTQSTISPDQLEAMSGCHVLHVRPNKK